MHDLVAIPSTSTNEAAAVRFLTAWMADHGLETEIDSAGNAIGRTGTGPRQSSCSGISIPCLVRFRCESRRILFGRGAVDAKGPLATFAVAAVQAAARNPGLRITVVGAVGEEHIGSVGARQVATWPAPDLCVIGEPSGWDALCLGYRGSVTATYRMRQESRHTAGPGEASAEKVVAFWNALTAEVGRRNGDAIGFGALTPAIRDMGTCHDGLTDEAWMHLGLRLPPGSTWKVLFRTCTRRPVTANSRFTEFRKGCARPNRFHWCHRFCARSGRTEEHRGSRSNSERLI